MRVRLTNYDYLVVNTSAGRDSQAMMDYVCTMARKQGVLDRVVAVHCDLAEEEWEGTKELAEEHSRHYGIRFEVVKRPQGGILKHTLDRHASLQARGKQAAPWPSPTERWCTSDHKRSQVGTLFTRLSREKGRRVRILNCMGMRAAESCARSKLLPFRLDKRNTNSKRVVHVWLPIHSWTADEVWERNRQAGTRSHHAYFLGMSRLSCCFCLFAPREALMLAGKHNRELLDRYIEVEDRTGYTFQSGLALKSIRDALERGEEPGEVRTWEM